MRLPNLGHLENATDVRPHAGSPDDVQFVEAIPHTATGNILKTKLRETFKDYKLPTT